MKIIKTIMHKLSSLFQIQTLRTKLVLSFLILGLIPFLAFAWFSYDRYLGALQERITTYSEGVVVRMQKDLDSYLTDIDSLLDMKNDYYINQFIKLKKAHDFEGNRKYTFRLWEDFNTLTRIKAGIEDVALTFNDGQRFSTYGLYYATPETMSLYDRVTSKNTDGYLISRPYYNFLNKPVITVARVFNSESSGQKVMISADVSLEVLESITNVKLGNNGYVFIVDNSGYIIFHPQQNMIGKKSDYLKTDGGVLTVSGNRVYTREDQEYILTYTTSKKTGWRIISQAPAREISGELHQLKNFTFLIILFILLMVVLLTIYLSNTLTYPLRELEELTKRAANNDLSVQIKISGNDEIAQLGKSFNKMIERIKKLMQQNIEEQKLIRKLEMESLENQIKPHFIYNTLDLIIGYLESDNSEKASFLIEALGKFFRLTLNHGKELVMIRNELEHVKNYLYIQQQRHGEEYEYIINIKDKEILNKYMPKLLLQPLVENAIYHGILKVNKSGLIIIRSYLKEGVIIFEVIDNGVGMAREKVQEINDVLRGKQDVRDEKQFFGLRNVNERIKLKFGPEYGLFIDSETGKGTRAIIKIGIIDEPGD